MKPEDKIYFLIIYAALFLMALVMMTDSAQAQERVDIQASIVDAAHRNGIDPALALAIAEVESQFNPNAIGPVGEIGVFQLRPEFHAVEKGRVNHNIEVAMRYLAYLQRACAGYGDAFFVCYNYGPARKLKHPHRFPYYVKVKAVMENGRRYASN